MSSETNGEKSPEEKLEEALNQTETASENAKAAEKTETDVPEGEDAIEVLNGRVDDLTDRLLRTAAELENVRRRSEKEKTDAKKFGISSFARDLMSVADNFQRALDSISDEARTAAGDLITGIEMTERELMAAFQKNGIRPVNPDVGEKFDPNFHQAIAEIPDETHPNGSVVTVTQIGYVLDDRLLRPAMVVVAKNANKLPPTAESGEANEESGDETPADPGSKLNTTA